ncbi:hypothetical protein HPB48_013711 [Haemaphysalis longicornis]|uniref:LIM zinc-binding domain-containing protein n=1 Tax=Haemaphysalis longicornis TaxID=44386 RepID=A0A9J6GFQ8_HAELO|nr:hypothetical protein HPB48_013711 [Haemaphysalis longicornis]
MILTNRVRLILWLFGGYFRRSIDGCLTGLSSPPPQVIPMMEIKAEVHRWNPEVHRSPVLGGPGAGSGPVPMMSPAALSHAGPECAGCQKPIRERFLLKALDQLWHEDCLKCACCDCRLGRWAPRCSPRPTSSSARGTTSGERACFCLY